MRTRSIAPEKFHPKISKDSRRSARLESRCRRNMAGSVCRNAITDAPQFCLVVGTEMLQPLFLRISRSELRSRYSCLEQKSRNKNICRASQAAKFLRSH